MVTVINNTDLKDTGLKDTGLKDTGLKDTGLKDTGSNKKVLLAAPRGYCAGVDRAVIAVEKALDHYGAPVYVRKQIVHNKHVVRSLERRGAIFVEEVDEAPEGCVMIFSAHGVSPAVVALSASRNQQTIDATCPLVTKVHREVQRFEKEGYDILLVGHEGHEEVEGTAGQAPGIVQLIDGNDDIAKAKVKDQAKSSGFLKPPCRLMRPWKLFSRFVRDSRFWRIHLATTFVTQPKTARLRSRKLVLILTW